MGADTAPCEPCPSHQMASQRDQLFCRGKSGLVERMVNSPKQLVSTTTQQPICLATRWDKMKLVIIKNNSIIASIVNLWFDPITIYISTHTSGCLFILPQACILLGCCDHLIATHCYPPCVVSTPKNVLLKVREAFVDFMFTTHFRY
jgi:hypothetical protein